MNIGDKVDEFLCKVREHDGFANDRNFDLIAGQVFGDMLKATIEAEREACALILDEDVKRLMSLHDQYECQGNIPSMARMSGAAAICERLAEKIRARGKT